MREEWEPCSIFCTPVELGADWDGIGCRSACGFVAE